MGAYHGPTGPDLTGEGDREGGPVTTMTVPDWPVLGIGAPPAGARTVQHLLRHHGFDLEMDARFGPVTEEAVVTFQHTRELGVDGTVNPETWATLVVRLQVGLRSDAVRALQDALNARLGAEGSELAPLAVDGCFGARTDERIRRFQRARGLVVDGVVGPLTWRALVSEDTAA
jgi:peptidoglycan hydrolase-like protein with peptidoglycan-binding domain